MRLIRAMLLLAALSIVATLSVGFVLEGIQPPLERTDAIIVISGDEDFARLRQGVRLWRDQWAPRLILSGAAKEGPISNAEAMQRMAVAQGVPRSTILLDELAADTFGNAVNTRRIMEDQRLRSAIVVTSPYHLQRAMRTFERAYESSGIRLIGSAAPDSAWRKQGWWQNPELRLLTLVELEKLVFVSLTGRYHGRAEPALIPRL